MRATLGSVGTLGSLIEEATYGTEGEQGTYTVPIVTVYNLTTST